MSNTNFILAGVGKTVLAYCRHLSFISNDFSSIVINYLQRKFLSSDDIGIACIYFNHKENISPPDILGSLLKHLVQRKTTISKEIRDLYQKHLARETRPTFTELSEILQRECRNLSTFYVVVDALDECPDDGNTRAKMFSELQKLRPILRLLVTGRPHITTFTLKFEDAVRLDIRASDSDIEKYIEGQIEIEEKLEKYVKRNEDLRKTIRDTIVSKAKGMYAPHIQTATDLLRFLMAQLHISVLARQRTRNGILSALEQLPSELDDVYDSILDRIYSQNSDDANLAINILKWITYAKEPLQPTTLQHAVAIKHDSTDIDDGDLIDVEDLVSLCAGIVTVDRERGIIRLVHYTTQDYLENRLPNAHADIAMTCLTYLGFDVLDEPCKNRKALRERLARYELLSYAARYWAEHARGDGEERLTTLVFKAFQTQGKRDSMEQTATFTRGSWNFFRTSTNRSLLHIVSKNGLSMICRTLLCGSVNYDELYA